MKRFMYLMLAAAMLTSLALFAGCSDDNPTGGGPTGDLNDPRFLAVQNFFSDAGVADSWQGTIDFAFRLIELQFTPPVRQGGVIADPTQNETLIDSAFYNYSDVWHIWHAYGKVIDFDDTTVVEVWDSVSVWVGGEAQQNRLDTLNITSVDSLNVHAHYGYDNINSGCGGSGHHSLHLTLAPVGLFGALVFDISVVDTLDGAPPCISDSCSLLLATSGTFGGVTFPLEYVGGSVEPADCPTSGTAFVTASIDLSCTGQDPNGLDTLDVSGAWALSVNVVAADDIRMTFSDGTTSWAVVDTCTPGTVMRLPALKADD